MISTGIDKDAAIRYFYQETVLGFYSTKTHEICVYLDRIIDTCLKREKSFEERLCYILTHEEIHHWLTGNEDQIITTQFDNIASEFMKDM